MATSRRSAFVQDLCTASPWAIQSTREQVSFVTSARSTEAFRSTRRWGAKIRRPWRAQ